MKLLETALYGGAAAQFSILIASSLTPKALDWKGTLAQLPKLLRQLFWIYGTFIVLCSVSFSVITLFHAPELATGTPLARSFCGFVAVFWGLRLVVQIAVLDARPFLTTRLYRIGYHLLTLDLIIITVVYTWATFH